MIIRCKTQRKIPTFATKANIGTQIAIGVEFGNECIGNRGHWVEKLAMNAQYPSAQLITDRPTVLANLPIVWGC